MHGQYHDYSCSGDAGRLGIRSHGIHLDQLLSAILRDFSNTLIDFEINFTINLISTAEVSQFILPLTFW